MFLSHRRIILLLILFVSILLTANTAAGLAQPFVDRPDSLTGNSSITICLDNAVHPDPIDFEGDLGSFTLVGHNACHTTSQLNTSVYNISENLPPPWFATSPPWCRETSGSGSQWQTTLTSVSIDLAAASDVECRFRSLPNPDEPNDSMPQATQTTYGAIIGAALGPHPDVGPGGDVDFYRFHGFGGDTLSVYADIYDFTSDDCIPQLTLRDAGGAVIANKSLGYPSSNLEHKLPATADYYLEMVAPSQSASGTCTGRYSLVLSLEDPYEPNDTPATAAPIMFGDVFRAYIDNYDGDPAPAKDHDYYRFQGSARDEVIINVSRFNDEQQLGCDLLDAAEVLLAQDSGSGCLFEHTLPADGDYLINVFYKQSPVQIYSLARYWYGPWNGPYALSLDLKNEAPVANPDSYEVLAAGTLTATAPGVLDNDTDANGDPLTAVLTTDAEHGDLELLSDGSFTYKPDTGYIGPDSFQYHAHDGADPSPAVDVTITVKARLVYLPIILYE